MIIIIMIKIIVMMIIMLVIVIIFIFPYHYICLESKWREVMLLIFSLFVYLLANIFTNRAAETQVWGWEAANDHGVFWREVLIPAAFEGVQPSGAEERAAGGTDGKNDGWQLAQGLMSLFVCGWLGWES